MFFGAMFRRQSFKTLKPQILEKRMQVAETFVDTS
jgi:hypothetical protein